MFECRGEGSEHYQAPLFNCCLAEQSHRKLTDRRHGRKLSDFPNATVRDIGDIYARQHSNLRSTSVLLFERQNCRFPPLPPRYHSAGRAFRHIALDHSRERLQDRFAASGAVHGTISASPGTPFVSDSIVPYTGSENHRCSSGAEAALTRGMVAPPTIRARWRASARGALQLVCKHSPRQLQEHSCWGGRCSY